MKTRLIFLLPLLFFLISCGDSDSETAKLELSQSTFDDVSANGETLKIDVTCNSSWSVSSNKQWCVPNKKNGENDGELTLSITASLDSNPRSATVTIISNKVTKTIQITQEASSSTAEEHHYNLPIIFHVLYKDQNDPLQYVSSKRLSSILDIVNNLYKNTVNSVDMNLTFSLATVAPSGKQLAAPGIEYVEWPETYPIDCEKFMQDNSGKYVDYLWDPNLYINVMIYNFESDPHSNSTILGISHLPFSTKGSTFLEGLNEINYSYLELKNLKFPYCTSINSLFINSQSTETIHNTADVTVTIAHELGHYLGLHHVFSETERGNSCEDTDYCTDTPTYNKEAYDMNYAYIAANEPENFTFANLVNRENCLTGESFVSHNIMDYAISHSDQFTPEQRARIRHVLLYSPLIPGPKAVQEADTRSAPDGLMKLPIRTAK
mgnify:CR=1 FL=1